MKRLQLFQYAATGIAGLGLVLPSGVLAADANRTPVLSSTAESPAILDVGLGEGGTLTGQVLSPQGAPLAQTIVTVRSSGSDVASAVTDTQGSFSVRGLQGGVHEVKCSGASATFRLWTANASPPSANKRVLIVAGGQVTRGQSVRGLNAAGTLVVVGLMGGIVAAGVITQDHQSGS